MEIRVQRAWGEVLGPTIMQYTRNIYVRDKVLHVSLTSSVLRSELTLCRERLVKSLNDYAGASVITNIVFSLSVAFYHSQYYLLGQVTYTAQPQYIYSAERSIDGVFCYYVIHFCLVEWLYRDLRYHLEPEAYANLGSVERGKKAVVESLPRPMRFLSLSKATPGTIIKSISFFGTSMPSTLGSNIPKGPGFKIPVLRKEAISNHHQRSRATEAFSFGTISR